MVNVVIDEEQLIQCSLDRVNVHNLIFFFWVPHVSEEQGKVSWGLSILVRAAIHGRKFLPNLNGVGESKDDAQKVADDENVGCGLAIEVVLVPHKYEGANLYPRNEHVDLIENSQERFFIVPVPEPVFSLQWRKKLNFN